MVPTLLFAYGTLAPAGTDLAVRDGWVADRVRGRLYDLGPYPALIDCGAADAPWVEGFVRAVTAAELGGRLDPYEGVDEGLYRRVPATTEAGRLVWVYVYAQPLPPGARGPLPRWERPRPAGSPGATPGFLPQLPAQAQETDHGPLSRPGDDSRRHF
jgi:gamma-glutamylcyclotransferase (GGCT)/AIG2-like uncharacterized protein YtfP